LPYFPQDYDTRFFKVFTEFNLSSTFPSVIQYFSISYPKDFLKKLP